MKEILTRALTIANNILSHDEILIVTHIDADGICSGSIAYESLERIGKTPKIMFVKQLDEITIEKIKNENMFVWFTDLGSGCIEKLTGLDFVISDHHTPSCKHTLQLNPIEFGYDGTIALSGSGATYLVASFIKDKKRSLFDFERSNLDLAQLAVVGSIGDMQDQRFGKLVGINRVILNEAVSKGFIMIQKDLRFFGKQTRPIAKMLEFNTTPIIPGLSCSESGSLEFITSLNIDPWVRWIDLDATSKRKIVSALVRRCMEANLDYETILKLVGECYILTNQPEGTERRDAAEYSTLLNATARHGKPLLGLRVCLGDEEAFKKARNLLRVHRKQLSQGIRLVDEIGIEELENLQYFNAGNEISDTVIGIIAGLVLYKFNVNKPIIAFAETDGGIKVSARANYELVEIGLNLAEAMKIAARLVGGIGGGHSVAAGAKIPEGTEGKFLEILDGIIGEQLKR
ncbi:recombinase RecJ [Archaeoglobales archaeon ex4484_92]|nr:MAG: recombinase RecJ [Archaeoglobales archaeon ex4484_92]